MLSRIVILAKRAALVFAMAAAAGFVVVADAAAQEVTTIYSVSPQGAASVNAKGQLIALEQTTGGELVITVSAVRGPYENGVLIATTGIGAFTTTLRILTACSVGGGCAAFGINDSATDAAGRRDNFANSNPDTLRQFIASGADINEYAGSERVISVYLTYLFAAASKPVQVSMMLSAGASVNAQDADGDTMLYAAAIANDGAFDILLTLQGVNINMQANDNTTPLDNMAETRRAAKDNTTAFLVARARQMRLTNATCNLYGDLSTYPDHLLCHPPQSNPTLPNNANKIFIVRSDNLRQPGIIGILTTPPPPQQ